MKNILTVLLFLFCYSAYAQLGTATEALDEAYALMDKKEYNSALILLNKSVREMPDSVSLYITRGILLNAYKRYDEAIDDYTTALGLTDDPEAKVACYINRSAARNTDREGAYSDLMLALEQDSTNIDVLNNLSIVCGYMGKMDEALDYLKQVVIVDNTYLPGYVNLGFTYQKLDEHEAAIKYFDQALVLDPDSPRAYSNRSFSKLKLNDLKGATKDINRSLKLFPGNSYAYKIRAMIYIQEGRMDEACEDLNLAKRMYYTEEYGDEVDLLLAEHCK